MTCYLFHKRDNDRSSCCNCAPHFENAGTQFSRARRKTASTNIRVHRVRLGGDGANGTEDGEEENVPLEWDGKTISSGSYAVELHFSSARHLHGSLFFHIRCLRECLTITRVAANAARERQMQEQTSISGAHVYVLYEDSRDYAMSHQAYEDFFIAKTLMKSYCLQSEKRLLLD